MSTYVNKLSQYKNSQLFLLNFLSYQKVYVYRSYTCKRLPRDK